MSMNKSQISLDANQMAFCILPAPKATSLESFCVSQQELERPTPEIPAA